MEKEGLQPGGCGALFLFFFGGCACGRREGVPLASGGDAACQRGGDAACQRGRRTAVGGAARRRGLCAVGAISPAAGR